ncbi:DUF2325 domain-containing protein [Natranaerobius thermophilus]|uniref:Dihydroorotate dehydrogenase n=1 Tax=Natranaerobius thermophilus (strain ATCC BAA-1301 / DSM 18059 / JW/NM-WN-LF) TaxID=457570 RepID=B2A5A9_NATTJ|nr:DUF2325 domain-containing protein [Natranaerobius thermophilus]ACB83943.1 conserved hypothetical protein [Natranaerobius thermophilus JW/NM-WN-LF]
MTVLIVGGDKVDKIKEYLEQEVGATRVKHVTGRKERSMELPSELDLVLTDFINHNLCKNIKCQAKEKCVSTLFSKRSLACITKSIYCWKGGGCKGLHS